MTKKTNFTAQRNCLAVVTALLTVFSAISLSGCAAKTVAPDFEETLTPYAFAVAMTYYDGAWESENDYTNAEFLWQASGWYAAFLCRQNGQTSATLTESDAKALQRLVNSGGSYAGLPAEWPTYGYAVKTGSGDGAVYEFPFYKSLFDSFFGVTMEYRAEISGSEIDVGFTWHYEDGSTSDTVYKLTFSESGGEYFLSGVTLPPAKEMTETTSPINFTYEDLYKANLLSNLFAVHKSVRGEYTGTMDAAYKSVYWLFPFDGSPAYQDSTTSDGGATYNVSGWYKGLWYSWNGEKKRVIATPDDEYVSFDGDCYLSNIFDPDADMVYMTETENNIVFLYQYQSYTAAITVDRGTLMLQMNEWMDASQTNSGSTVYTYDVDVSSLPYMDAWKGKLRKVTFIIEKDKTGQSTVVYNIPAAWEVLSEEYYISDAYLDAAHTRPYEYPGDGIDYTVYLTEKKQ